jgi:RNA polymerase sigma-70 factor (ECF subfamily)
MLVNPSFDEKALLKQLATGDENAFLLLYRYHEHSLKNFVRKFVKSPELTEDITQEIFIKAWENRNDLAEIRSFRAWLLVVARHHTLNVLKRAAQEEAARSEIIRHFQLLRNEVEEEILSREYQQHLKKLLASLPPQTRKVFRLCREQSKSYEEVAAILGISRNGVKKHIVRGMKTFKDSLRTDLDISLPLLLMLLQTFF